MYCAIVSLSSLPHFSSVFLFAIRITCETVAGTFKLFANNLGNLCLPRIYLGAAMP